MTKQISCNANANSLKQHVIQIKNGIIKHVNVNVNVLVRITNILKLLMILQ